MKSLTTYFNDSGSHSTPSDSVASDLEHLAMRQDCTDLQHLAQGVGEKMSDTCTGMISIAPTAMVSKALKLAICPATTKKMMICCLLTSGPLDPASS